MLNLTQGMRIRVRQDATGPAESYRGRGGSVEALYPRENIVDIRLDSGKLGLKMAFRPASLEPEVPRISPTSVPPKATPVPRPPIARPAPRIPPAITPPKQVVTPLRERRQNAPAQTKYAQRTFICGDAVIVTNQNSQFRDCRGTVRDIRGDRVKAEVFVGKHVCMVDFPETSLRRTGAVAEPAAQGIAETAPRSS